jgi:hypothetical protein
MRIFERIFRRSIVSSPPASRRFRRTGIKLAAAGALLAASFSFLTPVRAGSDEMPAQTFYAQAVETMRDLPQPQYVAYTMKGEGARLDVDLVVRDHFVWLQFSPGRSRRIWQLRHRTHDYASEIVQESGMRLVTQRSFFDPTWYGAYRALRDGMLNYQDLEHPLPAATPAPAPSSTPDLRTIAVVSVMGTGIYSVEDRGSTSCENGDAGRALHLTARDRAPEHQLSDAIVDLRSMHFCMLRFSALGGADLTGFVEQHYGDTGGYWVQTGGLIDGTIRMLGIALHHGTWQYRLTGVTFPAKIEAAAFVKPLLQ